MSPSNHFIEILPLTYEFYELHIIDCLTIFIFSACKVQIESSKYKTNGWRARLFYLGW